MAGAWFDDPRVSFASAGLHALVGQAAEPDVADALAVFDVTVDRHRARQYEGAMAQAAGLVLTATRSQSEQVLREQPRALRRVFTVREFARLTASAPRPLPVDLTEAVAAVAALRGQVPGVAADADDVADPYRRGPAASRAMVAQLAPAVGDGLLGLGVAPRRPAASPRRPLPYPRAGGRPELS